MKITKKQLKRIIQEEAKRILREQENAGGPSAHSHHWPTVDWSNVDDLVDKWESEELDSFNRNDPSMIRDELSVSEARELWNAQVFAASDELKEDLSQRIRDLSLVAMKEMTERLINGDFE